MKLTSRLAAQAVLSPTQYCRISAAKAPACSLCTMRWAAPLARSGSCDAQGVHAPDTAEAHICKAALEAEGIEALVQGEALAGVIGGVPAGSATAPRVWILDDSRAAGAAAVVARFGFPAR